MVQEAFYLTTRIETQIQVANSFKMELSSGYSALDFNEINICDTSCDKLEINEVSKSNKWNSGNYRRGGYSTNLNFGNKNQYNKKLRITNLEVDGNTRRETPRSLSYMNSHISSLHNLVSPFSSNLT